MKEEMTNLENELRESEAQAEKSSVMSGNERSLASQNYDIKYRKYQQYNSEVKTYKFKQVPNYDDENGASTKKVLWSPKIRMGYIVHLIFKFIFEMMFFYSVYWYQTRQTGVSCHAVMLRGANCNFRKQASRKFGIRPIITFVKLVKSQIVTKMVSGFPIPANR